MSLAANSLRRGLIEARRQWIGRSSLGNHLPDFDVAWCQASHLPGWFGEHRARAMYAAMVARPPRTIVEIGSYLGKSTVFLAASGRRLGSLNRLVAIDPHTGDKDQLEALGAQSIPSLDMFLTHIRASGHEALIDAVVDTSLGAANAWPSDHSIDYLFVDGWHTFDAVVQDGRAWLPFLSNRGVVVFDDAGQAHIRSAVIELAIEKHFNLWGFAFGQAFGGSELEAPEPLATILRRSRTNWSRRLGA
jgi:predicted O-methyltransferase YrrM